MGGGGGGGGGGYSTYALVYSLLQYASNYKDILEAVKGSLGEKRLAPGFITKFFRYFPSLHDAAIDAILDLIEDDDSHVRLPSIMCVCVCVSVCISVCALISEEGGVDNALYFQL